MGTWLGHAAPGVFFLGMGIWWMIRTFQEFLTKQDAYHSTLTKRCQPCGGMQKLNIETVITLLLVSMGIAAEVITGLNADYWPEGNTQHATMYFAFGLVALVDLLLCFRVKFIPPGSEYIMYVLALTVELLLFRYHLHDRDPVDVHIHMLLVYTISANIGAAIAEYAYPTNKHAAIGRAYFTLVQGSWFVQIAFTLYNPVPGVSKMDMADLENVMNITTIYSWHLLGWALGSLVCGACIQWCCGGRNNSSSGEYAEEGVSLLPQIQNNNSETTTYSKHFQDYTTDEEDVAWSSQKLQVTNTAASGQ